MKNCRCYVVGVFYIGTICASSQQPTPPVSPAPVTAEARTTLAAHPLIPASTRTTSTHDLLNSFLQPVDFTRTGFNSFFTTIFNSTLYAERFLPSCFVHLADFLDYGKKHQKPHSYYESVFTLFHHRLKESTWVNSYALLVMIDQIPEYIDPLTNQQQDALKAAIKADLETSLNERSFLLKDRPEQFYTEITQRIMEKIKKVENEGTMRDVQKSLTLFLESAMGKLIWTPHEQEDIWKTIKLLAKKCELLYQMGCLASLDDVNRLLWSMLYRFGYFIECTGPQLTMEFYQKMRDDIAQDPPSFLMIEEPEEWLISKKKYLENVMTKAEIKLLAQQQGILTDLVTTPMMAPRSEPSMSV